MAKGANIIIIFGNNDIKNFNLIRDFVSHVNGYYILGNKDLFYASQNYNENLELCEWLKNQYTGLRLEFNNGSNFIITYGGLNNFENIDEVKESIEISFINNEVSHQKYTGNLGYLITNSPAQDKIKMYKYSVSLGITEDKEYITIQEVNKNGLGQTFYL